MKEVHTMKQNLLAGIYTTEVEANKKGLIVDKEKNSWHKLVYAKTKMPGHFAEAQEFLWWMVYVSTLPTILVDLLVLCWRPKYCNNWRFLKVETLLAITNDSDMPVVGGDSFVALKDYTKNGMLTIVSTSKETSTQMDEKIAWRGKDIC